MKIIFATKNEGKVAEMRTILKNLAIEIMTAAEFGITEEIIESGKTFEENALIKSRYVAQKTNAWAIADDSGLCLEALGGAPGVYSARWPRDPLDARSAGQNLTPADYEKKTIESLKNETNRRAWFESAVALVAPDGHARLFHGRISGTISLTPRGVAVPGLPYDTVFIPDGYRQTFAEIGQVAKNKISHRELAFRQLRKFLANIKAR